MHRAVHGGQTVGLHHVQDGRRQQIVAHIVRQLAQLAHAVEDLHLGVAQNAEAGIRHDLALGLLATARIAIFAVSQEGEVIRFHPAQEGAGLGQLVGGQIGWRGFFDILHLGQHGGAHRAPVLHRRAHIGQNAGQPLLDMLQRRQVRLFGGLDVHDRFQPAVFCLGVWRQQFDQLAGFVAADAGDRVDDEMHGHAVAAELRRDRIDEERHVVIDDLDGAVQRVPAICLEGGGEGADLRRIGGALGDEAPGREHGAEQILRIAVQNVVGRHMRVEQPDKGFQRLALPGRKTLPCQTDNGVDGFLLAGLEFAEHDLLPLGSPVRVDAVSGPAQSLTKS